MQSDPMSATQNPARPPRIGIAVYALGLATFAFGSGAFIFGGMLDEVARDLHVGIGAAGQLQTGYVLCSALAGPGLAFATRFRGRKPVLLTLLGIAAALNLACIVAPGFGSLMLLRCLLGAVAATAGPLAATSAGAMVGPEQRGSAIAIVIGGMTFAFIFGTPLGTVIGSLFGWRASFALTGTLAIVALAGISALLPSDRVDDPVLAVPGRRIAIAPLLPYLVTTFLCFTASATTLTYLAPIVRAHSGIQGAGIAIFQMAGGVGCLLGLTAGARAADRGHDRRAIQRAALLMASGYGLQALAFHPFLPGWAISAGMALTANWLASFALFSSLPVIQHRLLVKAEGAGSVVLSLNASATGLGQALGAATGGIVSTVAGIDMNPVVSILVVSLALAGWLLVPSRAAPPCSASVPC